MLIKDKYLEQAKQILLKQLANTNIKVYLFGSRAKGTARETSDIDIALEGEQRISLSIIGNLKEIFEESSIPYEVDIIDLNVVSDEFKQAIMKEAILWKD